jgi:hypothetical protein
MLPNPPYTLSAWLNPDENDTFLFNGGFGATDLISTHAHPGKREFSYNSVTLARSTMHNPWVHIAIVAESGGTGYLYVDGNRTAITGLTSGNFFPDQYSGLLDEMNVYGKALTHFEINVLAHQPNVTLTQGFYLGKYEVTQAQYEAVMTGNTDGLSATPSQWPNNPNRPVEQVSWNDAQIFLARLNSQQSANIPTGWAYVLPTESQWEYACRAGTTTAYSWGNDINSTRANYSSSGLSQTSDVGFYAANPWGFFDMHGNIGEWTADWYDATYPSGNPVIDPTGPASGAYRVFRGGFWGNAGSYLRSASRSYGGPGTRNGSLGFRVGFKQQ